MSVIRSLKTNNNSSLSVSHNASISDSQNKVQTSYLVESTVLEKRPGGDVILSTPHGAIRTSTPIHLKEGDKVTVRLIKNTDDTINAHIISKSEPNTIINKIDKLGIDLLEKYIIQSSQDDNSSEFIAKISYVANNRNALKYGNIKPGDEITIRTLPPIAKTSNNDVVIGEVLGNTNNTLILNSSIGMLTIQAKSNLSISDKVLFKVIGIPDDFEQTIVKTSIGKILNDITLNKTHLNMLLDFKKHIEDEGTYKRFLQLISSSGHSNPQIAKLFHNAQKIPSSQVERWIDQEILEPFESSSKSSIFETLLSDMESLSKHMIELKLIPDRNAWQTLEISIHEDKNPARMKVRKEKNVVEFMIDLDNNSIGKITIHGFLMPKNDKSHFPALNIKIKHQNKLPETLISSITSSFATHKSLSLLEGQIQFEYMQDDKFNQSVSTHAILPSDL